MDHQEKKNPQIGGGEATGIIEPNTELFNHSFCN